LSSDYAVLFGDEPTGNLDPANAHELFEVMRGQINEKSSAIIVSHDLELAIRHAEMIVVISKSKNGYGEVLPENIYTHEQLASLDVTQRLDLKNRLLQIFKSDSTEIGESKEPESKPLPNRSFNRL